MSDNPFWFVDEKLLVALLKDEFRLIAELFAKYPKLPEFFDLPEGTPEQKSAAFILLARRRLIEEIDEKFLGMHQQPPSIAEEEKDVIRLMQGLVAADAPEWVLEINNVAELLPTRVYEALPEPLRRGSGFYANDLVQTQLIASAARELNSLEKIRALSEMVIDQQLKRLQGRWSASISSISVAQSVQQPTTTSTKPTRRTINREGWEQRVKLYRAIQNVLNRDSSLEGIEFCAQLDTRHAPPLFDWLKSGEWQEGLTWKEAWGDLRLRKKIRRVRQEAMKSR